MAYIISKGLASLNTLASLTNNNLRLRKFNQDPKLKESNINYMNQWHWVENLEFIQTRFFKNF